MRAAERRGRGGTEMFQRLIMSMSKADATTCRPHTRTRVHPRTRTRDEHVEGRRHHPPQAAHMHTHMRMHTHTSAREMGMSKA